jgi:hypothetical protein
VIAFFFTLILAVYQRLNGPTYPVKGSEIFAGSTITYRLLRSGTSGQSLPVRLTVSAGTVSAKLYHRRYPFIADETWSIIAMAKDGNILQAEIPSEPPAGKVAYKVLLQSASDQIWLNRGRMAVARFKAEVPKTLLIVHVIFMFAGLLLAMRTGLEALSKQGNLENLVFLTLATILLGGLILGPLVQYYAFGALWTGFPLGKDLTDNKTFLAVALWSLAFFMQKKSRWWVVAAAVLMIAVYLIPHSLMGSELDYVNKRIKTGWLRLLPSEISACRIAAYSAMPTLILKAVPLTGNFSIRPPTWRISM